MYRRHRLFMFRRSLRNRQIRYFPLLPLSFSPLRSCHRGIERKKVVAFSIESNDVGVGISAMGVLRPDLIMKCVVPVVMAGIIAIYGLVVSVLVSDGLKQQQALYTGFIQLGAGLSVGLAGLAAGFAIGIVGDAGVRGVAQQPRLFVGMILILIFSEVLGLYGLIVALLLNTKATEGVTC